MTNKQFTMPDLLSIADEMKKKVTTNTASHLDFLAFAILQATGVSADQLELVQTLEGNKIKWHFEIIKLR